jgi:hypothetical protein
MRWLRNAGICLAIVVSRNVFAFAPEEHKVLSTVALDAACRLVSPSPEMGRAIVELATPRQLAFGDFTVAVDSFQSPDTFLGDPGTADEVVRSRRGNLVMRGLAAHHNAAHFQDGALQAWQKYHLEALEKAQGSPRAALLSEAVALHYLQDFFAAGHFVTPRDGMHDAIAGYLHDRYNGDGVDVELKDASDPLVRDILDRVLQALGALPQTPKGDIDVFSAALLHEDLNRSLKFHGDDDLIMSEEHLGSRPEDVQKERDLRTQRTFIEVLGTISVAQVLAASAAMDWFGLETCFDLRSAEPNARATAAGPARDPEPTSFQGPDGGARIVPNASRAAAPVISCQGGTWLAEYHAPVFGKANDLKDSYYYPFGFTARFEIATARRERGVRTNTDFLFFMPSPDPPHRLINRDTETEFHRMTFIGDLLGAVGVSHSTGDQYHAWGLLYDFYAATPVRALEWGIRVAPRRYTYYDTHHWKFDYGLKGTFGLEVVSIAAAVERARHIDLEGRFRPTYFFSLGAEMSIDSRWVHYGRKRH